MAYAPRGRRKRTSTARSLPLPCPPPIGCMAKFAARITSGRSACPKRSSGMSRKVSIAGSSCSAASAACHASPHGAARAVSGLGIGGRHSIQAAGISAAGAKASTPNSSSVSIGDATAARTMRRAPSFQRRLWNASMFMVRRNGGNAMNASGSDAPCARRSNGRRSGHGGSSAASAFHWPHFAAHVRVNARRTPRSLRAGVPTARRSAVSTSPASSARAAKPCPCRADPKRWSPK